jgi:beta-galactosidase GanA
MPFANLPELNLKRLPIAFIALATFGLQVCAQQLPRLETKDGRHAFTIDGKPFLILGAQINNSSSWPAALKTAWPALEAMHVNTVEAPVYWEQMEPSPGQFDFSTVDLLVNGAREHNLRLVILWFGTWKNGQNHYVPEWMKSDTKKYPRQISAYGKLLDVMSPNSQANLEADKHAFTALMRHIRETDSTQHTVIMMQVENESGGIGSVRDYSAAAQKLFAANVPESLTAALRRKQGTWEQVFGADADERFAAFSTASYINEVAKAGKAEYPLPMYCNVWLTYPVHALENRNRASAGQEYPSGGPQQQNIDLWKIAAPSIDILAPDFYSDDIPFFRSVVAAYARPDNPLFIPETGLSKNNLGPYFFYSLGHGAIGFSPFGVDYTGWKHFEDDKIPEWLSQNFALFATMQQQVAEWNLAGKLQTVVEEKDVSRKVLHFGSADVVVSFGYPQHDGEQPPGTPDLQGRAMIAQTGPMEFVVTGFESSVSFIQGSMAEGKPQTQQVEILRAEEGQYVNGAWQTARIWNGDQTDRGLNFHGANPPVIRIRLQEIPLYDGDSGRSN